MADINSVLATTMKVYGKGMFDNIMQNSAFLSWLRANGKEEVFHGPFINERIQITKNSTVAFRDAKGQISATEQDPFRVVQWVPKAVDGAVPIFMWDQMANEGPGEVSNLVKDLIQNLEESLTQHICSGVFASGGATALDGLEAIVATGNTYGSVQDTSGGVSALDRTAAICSGWWRAQAESTSGALAVATGATSMWRMYDACTSGEVRTRPDIIVTTDALYEKYNATLQQNQRYVSDKMADLGFQNVAFRNAVVVADQFCPAETMYFLNTNYLKLRPRAACKGKIIMTDKHQMIDYLAQVILAAWFGNFSCTRPRNQGKLVYKY